MNIYPYLAVRANLGPVHRQAARDRKTECVQQLKHQDECCGEMTAIQFANDKATPATTSSAQGCTMSRAARPTKCPEGYVAGVAVTIKRGYRRCDAELQKTGCSHASRRKGSLQTTQCLSADRAAQSSMSASETNSSHQDVGEREHDRRAAPAEAHLVGEQAGEAVHGEAGAHGLLLRVHHVRLAVHLEARRRQQDSGGDWPLKHRSMAAHASLFQQHLRSIPAGTEHDSGAGRCWSLAAQKESIVKSALETGQACEVDRLSQTDAAKVGLLAHGRGAVDVGGL